MDKRKELELLRNLLVKVVRARGGDAASVKRELDRDYGASASRRGGSLKAVAMSTLLTGGVDAA